MNLALRLAVLAAILAATACRPEVPPTEQPPVPTARANTELRDAIKAPQDKAKAAEDAIEQVAEAQRAAIDAAAE